MNLRNAFYHCAGWCKESWQKHREKKSSYGIPLIMALLVSWNGRAQTPTDGLMMPTGDACILLNYNYGSFDEYWEGSNLRTNETIATFEQHTILPMAAIGIFKEANLFVGLPYVSTRSTEPNGGKFAGQKGLQDFSVALKYRALRKEMGNGELFLLGTIAYAAPASRYLPDYMPYSLGLGAPEFSLRGIGEYKWKSGIYVSTRVAHLWRGTAKAERDFYYADGARYSFYMDVPNAWNYEALLGLRAMGNSLRLELGYVGQRSTSGDDIRAYFRPQPTNKVHFDRIGLFAQYFFKDIPGLGVQAYHNRTIGGLNVGKMNNTGVGVNYQFNFKKDENVQIPE